MTDEISVCHVVNVVRDTSMPADLGIAQAQLDRIRRVGYLSFYPVEPFRDMESVETATLNIPRGTYRIDRRQYKEARSILSEYDIIHTHHNHSGFYGKLIARRLGKPVIVTEHNNHGGFTRKGRIANGLTNVIADRVVCVSESVRESFKRWEDFLVSEGEIRVIHNGVDLNRIEAARDLDWTIYDAADIDHDSLVVGSAGMLSEQKAHSVLIEAIDHANARSDRPIELVISGDGELRSDLERVIEEAKYSDRLHLLGFLDEREQVYKMMHEIDVYAMPSRWEGFCVAALEAMALGNACLFSAIPEFQRPFNEVAHFHSVDDPIDLSHQLVELVSDPETIRELSEEARELILDGYTIERTAKRYLSAYLDVV